MDMEHVDIPTVKYLVMKTQGNFEYEALAILLLLNTIFTPQVESGPCLIRLVQQGQLITVTLFKLVL
jgi:hypothetical protein